MLPILQLELQICFKKIYITHITHSTPHEVTYKAPAPLKWMGFFSAVGVAKRLPKSSRAVSVHVPWWPRGAKKKTALKRFGLQPRFGDPNRFHPFHTFCCGDPPAPPPTHEEAVGFQQFMSSFLNIIGINFNIKNETSHDVGGCPNPVFKNKNHLDPCHADLPVGNPRSPPAMEKRVHLGAATTRFSLPPSFREARNKASSLRRNSRGFSAQGFGADFFGVCVSGLLGKSSRKIPTKNEWIWMDMRWCQKKCALSQEEVFFQ